MSGVNKVILVGNVGADAETKFIPSGSQVTNFSVATSESYTDKSGVKQEKTEWHRIVCWNKTAEIAAEYVKKGGQVYVEGKLQTRSWEAQDGTKKYSTEVVVFQLQLLGRREQRPDDEGTGQAEDFGPEPAGSSELGGDDDDLPF